MSAPKRSEAQILRDRAEVARLYLRGLTHMAIAAAITERRARDDDGYEYSRQMATADIKEIRKGWTESALLDFDARKAQELAKADNAEATAWEAWERSHGETVIRTTKTVAIAAEPKPTKPRKRSKFAEEFMPEPEPVDAGGFETEQTERVEYLAGDPRFLEIVLKCIDRRCKILGLLAPTKIAPTTPDGEREYADGALDRLASLVSRTAARTASPVRRKSD